MFEEITGLGIIEIPNHLSFEEEIRALSEKAWFPIGYVEEGERHRMVIIAQWVETDVN